MLFRSFSASLFAASVFGPSLDPTRSFMARNLSRASEALQINLGLVAAALPTMSALVLIAAVLRIAHQVRVLARRVPVPAERRFA